MQHFKFKAQLGLNLVFLWLLVAAPSLSAATDQLPQQSSAGFLLGLETPILGMQHLAFLLMAGLLCYTQSLRRLDLLFCLVAAIFANFCGLHWSLPQLPIDLAVVGSVGLLLLSLWFKGPGVRWSRWTLGIGGLLHGYVQGAALAGTSQSVFMMYVFGLGLMQVALAFGFGIFAARVAKASPDGFEGLENIVSSLGAGVTLTYLVKAFY